MAAVGFSSRLALALGLAVLLAASPGFCQDELPTLDTWWEWQVASLDAADLFARLGLVPEQLQALAVVLEGPEKEEYEQQVAEAERLQDSAQELQRLEQVLLAPAPSEADLTSADKVVAKVLGEQAAQPGAGTGLVSALRKMLTPEQAQLIDWREQPPPAVRAPEERTPEEQAADYIYGQLVQLRNISYVMWYNQKFTRATALYDFLAPRDVPPEERDAAIRVIWEVFDDAHLMSDEEFDARAPDLVYQILALFWGPESPRAAQAIGAPALTAGDIEPILSHPGTLWLLHEMGYGTVAEQPQEQPEEQPAGTEAGAG